MKRGIGYTLLALLALVASAVWIAPASKVLALAQPYLQNLSIAGAEGTLFKGKATQLNINGTALDNLSWRFEPAALLKGEVRFALQSAEPGLDLSGNIGWQPSGALSITEFKGRVGLPRLHKLAKQKLVYLNGTLELNIEYVELDTQGKPIAALGVLRLKEPTTALGNQIALGTLNANIEGDGGNLRATLGDEGGPVMLSGLATLNEKGEFELLGRTRARNEQNKDLTQLLTLLGPQHPEGGRALAAKGTLGNEIR